MRRGKISYIAGISFGCFLFISTLACFVTANLRYGAAVAGCTAGAISHEILVGVAATPALGADTSATFSASDGKAKCDGFYLWKMGADDALVEDWKARSMAAAGCILSFSLVVSAVARWALTRNVMFFTARTVQSDRNPPGDA